MGKALETVFGVLVFGAVLAWSFWLKPMKELNEKQNQMCLQAVNQRLSESRLTGLAHVVGQMSTTDVSANRKRTLLNVFIGSPPVNPPVERDSFFNAHALCDVDDHGLINIVLKPGSLATAGFTTS